MSRTLFCVYADNALQTAVSKSTNTKKIETDIVMRLSHVTFRKTREVAKPGENAQDILALLSPQVSFVHELDISSVYT